MLQIKVMIVLGLLLASFGCGPSGTSSSNTDANTNGPVEIKLDPNNMPPGLSTTPITLPSNGKLPPGISINSANVQTGKPIPGIPNPQTLRKQLGYPPGNANVSPTRRP